MFTTAHCTRVSVLSLTCALLLGILLPIVVFSQETVSSSTESSQKSDGGGTSQAVAPPYVTETLVGTTKPVGDFVVDPGKVDLTIKPGESHVVEMTVANRTGETREFKLSVEDITGSNNTDEPVVLLGDDRGPYSLKDYISFPHKSFTLKQGERARIPVTISVPDNADPGGLYGSVLVQTVTVEDRNTTGPNAAPRSAIVARVGTLFFVTVPGDVTRDGILKNFSTIPDKNYFQNGPINFGILFENKGPIHLIPYGEIRITNMLNEEVGFVQLEPWFTLPNSLRLREVSWNRGLLFGRYTATVKINRGYDDIVDTATITFWVMPWQWILGGFAVLFIVFFLIRSFFKKFEFKRKRD